MYANDLFPSKYIAAHDLRGTDTVVTIKEVAIEELNGKDGGATTKKGVMYFTEFERGMVLNKTNGRRIIALYGDETDKWIGQPITLYPSETDFGGETVPCIRVRTDAPEK